MARKDISTSWDRNNRNAMNDNFKELYDDYGNVVEQVSEKAFNQVVNAAKLIWKEPVNTFGDLPLIVVEGETRMVRDTGKIYRFQGGWKEIQQIDAGPVNEVDSRLTAQLAESMQNTIYNKKAVMYAHRGFRSLAPEGTVHAFELAGQYGFFGIEGDIQRTSDGDLFVYHDSELSNFTNGTGRMPDNTTAQVKLLKFTSGNNVDKYPNTGLCSFDEYVSIANKYNMEIIPEVSNSANLTELFRIIDKYNYRSKTTIQSSVKATLEAVRTIDKGIPLVYTTYRAVDESDLDYCATIKPCFMGVGVNGGFLPDGYIELAHNKGVGICAYTINSYGDYLKLLDAGVDILMSDVIVGDNNV